MIIQLLVIFFNYYYSLYSTPLVQMIYFRLIDNYRHSPNRSIPASTITSSLSKLVYILSSVRTSLLSKLVYIPDLTITSSLSKYDLNVFHLSIRILSDLVKHASDRRCLHLPRLGNLRPIIKNRFSLLRSNYTVFTEAG